MFKRLSPFLLMALACAVASGCDTPTASGAPDSQTGIDPGTGSPPEKLVVIEFDQSSKRFVMKNKSDKPVWFDGYSPTQPLTCVQRLTSDGWISTNWDWCGSGVKKHALDPGKSVALPAQLKAMKYNLELDIHIEEKYPNVDQLPVRVGTSYSRDEKAEEETVVWSDKIDPPPGLTDDGR